MYGIWVVLDVIKFLDWTFIYISCTYTTHKAKNLNKKTFLASTMSWPKLSSSFKALEAKKQQRKIFGVNLTDSGSSLLSN